MSPTFSVSISSPEAGAKPSISAKIDNTPNFLPIKSFKRRRKYAGGKIDNFETSDEEMSSSDEQTAVKNTE